MPESADLTALRDVVEGPLAEIAVRFSRLLAEDWPHQALVIFTLECTGRPRKVTGVKEIADKVAIRELEAIKARVEPGGHLTTTATLGGTTRTLWAVRDPGGTLLVLVPRASRKRFPRPSRLAEIFGIVATSIRQQVTQASPDYLAESRAASSERARTIVEMAAAHETALVTILTALRSTRLDDQRARHVATDSASAALVALRSAHRTDLALSEEQAHTAFGRLRREVRQVMRHHGAEVEFVAPPKDGRPLSGEVAHAARAMTCTAVLAFTTQPELTRLRVAWTSDETALHLDVRDQESGDLDVAGLRLQLDGRAKTLGATVEVDAVPGWGSRVTVVLPFEPESDRSGEAVLSELNRRELEVLRLVARGQRNKAIAATLGITESTVKFHVTGVLRKLDVGSRGEAAALALAAGISAGHSA
ncbi:helix-turn-helix transcriptional regulator [Amycolatopsis alba]|uniref:Helix-turn-helix transcriptional regulator n=1 Tax=Amycolatopsis alba DSM 44262 TaxID=1125972 RepID=A0A229S2G9_AMYAL|nr:helix-turn-helix transcriptional regulator [Amycolatopsis alba]OXM53117.1 helix-turn-helix transcriptional regulator [Amycolatopsis alba DSM 44262]